MTFFEFTILALAVFRITRLVTTDTIFDSARNRWWGRFPPHTSKLGYLITCNWCSSVWVASIVVVSAMIVPVLVFVYAVFAASAVAGLLTAYEEKD